jgi:cation diffusion facilitator CzcD-associated flavoprotein CzcO
VRKLIVVGAGQGGLVTAARLKMLGIPTLVIDKNERIGDNWRKRYRHLGISICSLLLRTLSQVIDVF